MTPERWEQINDLFQSAVECEPEERAAFLEKACRGDEALCREVKSLIACYEPAEGFIESPAFEVAPELLTNDKADTMGSASAKTTARQGELIGHYRVESLIGVGGMGEVYLARDERLGRKVALKFLPERLTADNTQLSRFKSEARAASALNHPNILTVHEIGAEGNRHFIATEFIDGVTLRALLAGGKMNMREGLDIAVQVASALAAAHEAGVVHRDIKPENIMVRRDGYVKVLDFGIAKLTEQRPASDDPNIRTTTLLRTHPGLLLGTVRYMSPEQIRGQSADARSDIWSLGVVIYEIVGGVPPFSGATPSDCIASVLKTEPSPLSSVAPVVSTELQSIVQKALRKNRDERYQTIAEMLADLRSLRGKLELQAAAPGIEALGEAIVSQIKRHKLGASLTLAATVLLALAIAYFSYFATPAQSPDQKSIAVLPFENLSRDPDNIYFAEGIQDEILTRLSKIGDLKVISRTSTQHYKSAPKNLAHIAKELGVAHVLEGSVQKSGDTVRVNVQLIKAANDSHVWADSFDRKLTDIFSVETEVAKVIAEQLRAKLTGQEEQVIAAKPTDNPEAYDAYLRGLAYSLKPANATANSLAAQKYLREAVRLDPKFALAWALLSSVDSLGYLTTTLERTVALREEARQAAETALALQPQLGEAILAKGYFHYACLKDYDTAIRYFDEARQLLPNDSRIPESLAYVTRRRGQWERSESYFNEAEQLDPRNGNLLTQHALSYMRLRRFPEALRKLDQVLNITPDDVRTVAFKAGIAQAQGDLPQAAALLAPLHPNADDPGTLETQVYQAILERRPAPIIPRLQQILDKPDPALGYLNGDLRFWLGWAQAIAGDHAAAQKSWQQARSELESFLKEEPENFNVLSDLALTNMGLGDKAAALALAERAIAANPIEKDAVSGPSPIDTLARVAAQIGEPDRAIAALQKLLSIPALTDTAAPITPALLRLDPMFDPLRNDPRFKKLTAPAQSPNEKSIAVLPFENRSRDPDNVFFTDGVQDEILTNLARIADLKVISRTSVMQYKSDVKRNLRQIANELGVAHVLEGSVQRAGDRVRINAQLIDARNDAHLWGETYDRDLADVFAIQSEIAKTIADQLQAKLLPVERSAIEQPPTANINAFDLYTRAKNLYLTVTYSSNAKQDLLRAADLLNEAVAQDPSFFQAYCQLALTHGRLYFYGFDHTSSRLAQAEAALGTASRMRPDSGETHLARARNLYWGYLDYTAALGELEIARRTLPNHPQIFELRALIQRRQGHWQESTQNLERLIELDPHNTSTLLQISFNYALLHRYRDEEAILDRALAIAPNEVATQAERALAELNWHANTGPMQQLVESIKATNPSALPRIADAWLLCALAERDAVAAEQALNALGENTPSLSSDNVYLTRLFVEGLVARMTKNEDKARAAFTAARAEQAKTVEAQPNYGPALCVLGLIDAGLGQKEDPLREGRRAIELLPVEKDAINGPAMIKYFAVIAAWVGENNLACEQLANAIRQPNALSYGQLKLLPFWDPLRGDPQFEKIVASLAPKD